MAQYKKMKDKDKEEQIEYLDKQIMHLKVENDRLKGQYANVKKAMDEMLGKSFTKQVIDRAELEYAIEQTNIKLEKRDWSN